MQREQLAVREFEYCPLSTIQSWSGLRHGQPLFESLLVFENYPLSHSLQRSVEGLLIDDVRSIEQTNYPLTLTVIMTPSVIRRIIVDNPACFMLKHEDWPGLEKISTLRGFQAEGTMRPLSILTGNGALFLDF